MGQLYVFDGEDQFKKECEQKALIAKKPGACVEHLASDLSMDDLSLNLQSQGLFSTVSCYVIDEPKWIQSSWDERDQQKAEAMLAVLKESQADILIRLPKKMDTRKKAGKWFQKHAVYKNFQPFKEWEDDKTVKWLCDYANNNQIQIDLEACYALVDLLGSDLRNLATQLDALQVSVQTGETISKQHILAFIQSHHVSILDVSEALQSAKLKDVYAHCSQLMDQGEEPIRMMGFLAKQLCLYRLCLLEPKQSDEALAKAAGKHPFVIKKTRQQLRAYSGAAIIDSMIIQLAKADLSIKKGMMPPQDALKHSLLTWLSYS